MEKQEAKNLKENMKSRLESLKNGIFKNTLKMFYNDEDRGVNCFEYLSSINKKICTDMGKGEVIDEPNGLIAGRHLMWSKKTYEQHCISEFNKKCNVDYCENSELQAEYNPSHLNDEL